MQIGCSAAASCGCGRCCFRQRALAAADLAVGRFTLPRRSPELANGTDDEDDEGDDSPLLKCESPVLQVSAGP